MQIKKFDSTNSFAIRRGETSINFNNEGQITISKQAVIDLGFKPGDKFAFIQDEKEPRNWYLLRDEKDGISSRKYSGSDAICLNSTIIARVIIDLAGKDNSISCKLIIIPVKHEGLTLYPIIIPKPE